MNAETIQTIRKNGEIGALRNTLECLISKVRNESFESTRAGRSRGYPEQIAEARRLLTDADLVLGELARLDPAYGR